MFSYIFLCLFFPKSLMLQLAYRLFFTSRLTLYYYTSSVLWVLHRLIAMYIPHKRLFLPFLVKQLSLTSVISLIKIKFYSVLFAQV